MNSTHFLIRLLGRPEIRALHNDGVAVSIRGTKPLELLCYLALNPDGVERDELARLFWPKSKPSAARHSLRQVLYSLRGDLSGVDFGSPETIKLDLDRFQVDTRELTCGPGSLSVERLDELVGGAFLTGLDFKGLDEVYDRAAAERAGIRLTIGEHIDVLAGSGALSEQDHRRLVEVAGRLGIQRARIPNSEELPVRVPSRSGALVGDEPLSGLFASTAEPGGVELWLVVGPLERVRANADAAPGAPLIWVTKAATGSTAFADLFLALFELPGSRGVMPKTDLLLECLQGGGDLPDSIEAETGLADLLDAVSGEAAPTVVLDVRSCDLGFAESLGRALARARVSGLRLVLLVEDEDRMRDPVSRQLLSIADSVNRIDLIPPPENGSSHRAVDAEQPYKPPPGRPVSRRKVGLGALLSGLVVCLAWLWWAGPDPHLDDAVVFCSERTGEPFLYYRDPTAGFVERVSSFPFTACPSSGVWAPETGRLYVNGRSEAGGLPRMWWFEPAQTLRADWEGGLVPELADFNLVALMHDGVLDGRYLLFETWDEADNRDVWVFDVVDRLRTRLTDHPAVDAMPSWDHASGTAYWSSHRSGAGDIYAYPWPDGPMRQVTDHPDGENYPRPFADTLALTRGREAEEEDGSQEVGWILPGGAGDFEAITSNDWNDLELTIAPDRTRACWQSERLGHFESDIVILERTTGVTRVIDLPGRQNWCQWSTDSRGVFILSSLTGGDPDVIYWDVEAWDAVSISDAPGVDIYVASVPRLGH